MPEDEFLDTVERLRIPYIGIGPLSVRIRNRQPGYVVLTAPFVIKNYDLTNISHCYKIYSGFKKQRNRTEDFLVLVDKKGLVVYVESQFGYVNFGP